MKYFLLCVFALIMASEGFEIGRIFAENSKENQLFAVYNDCHSRSVKKSYAPLKEEFTELFPIKAWNYRQFSFYYDAKFNLCIEEGVRQIK